MTDSKPTIAIIDCAHGNLFSIAQACLRVGLNPVITHDHGEIAEAAAVLLPGVGAFGAAMEALEERGLVKPLTDAASSGKPFIGICLGMQLLFEESAEFGRHKGLGLLRGRVVRFHEGDAGGLRCKVPQVGWNMVRPPAEDGWPGTLMEDISPNSYVYFLHSFYVRPHDAQDILALTEYGGESYCSAVQSRNITAFQFHPERSGPVGQAIFKCIARRIVRSAT